MLERKLVYETAVVARCWCGGTLKDLINYKEHQAAFINLTSPGLATEDFSFQVFASLCSPQKQVLTKPSSPFPSNSLSGSPRGPSNPFRGFEIPGSWIFIRGRGPAACAAPRSWEQLKGLPAARRETVLILCAGQTRCHASRPHIVRVWEGLCQDEWTFLRQGPGAVIRGAQISLPPTCHACEIPLIKIRALSSSGVCPF